LLTTELLGEGILLFHYDEVSMFQALTSQWRLFCSHNCIMGGSATLLMSDDLHSGSNLTMYVFYCDFLISQLFYGNRDWNTLKSQDIIQAIILYITQRMHGPNRTFQSIVPEAQAQALHISWYTSIWLLMSKKF
jgi:hypothetical protein